MNFFIVNYVIFFLVIYFIFHYYRVFNVKKIIYLFIYIISYLFNDLFLNLFLPVDSLRRLILTAAFGPSISI